VQLFAQIDHIGQFLIHYYRHLSRLPPFFQEYFQFLFIIASFVIFLSNPGICVIIISCIIKRGPWHKCLCIAILPFIMLYYPSIWVIGNTYVYLLINFIA